MQRWRIQHPAWLTLAVVMACSVAFAQEADEPAEAAVDTATAGNDPGSAEAGTAAEAEEKAAPEEDRGPLDEGLSDRVKARVARESQEDRERRTVFQQQRDELAGNVKRLEGQVRAAEARGVSLDERYAANEIEIETLGERLTERLGQMGELFGVVRLVSTDLSAGTWQSLTSLGLEARNKTLDRLGRSSDLPSTQDLERLWYALQLELTEQAKVSAYEVPVILEEDKKEKKVLRTENRQVIRAGPFTAISDGDYVQWAPEHQMVRTLARPPPPQYANTAERFGRAPGEIGRLAVDPSRGALLVALTATPSLWERVQQGGAVGYTIIGLGIAAFLLGVVRLVVLTLTQRRIDAQRKRSESSQENPLGRVLGVYEEYHDADPEFLELKLDEALLRERSGVERFLWLVQTVSIVAPLLGLLGTVTGMIQTFQAITLFGAGDPKIMAGGISEALITTTLGLVTAIPLVLLYALISNRAKSINDQLDEYGAGLVADRLERGLE
ncbi:MAG: MotA/TolQ/ExbB proton channel family protein [Myxococcota bacterium]